MLLRSEIFPRAFTVVNNVIKNILIGVDFMKLVRNISISGILVLLCFFSLSCKKQKTAWTGTIENVDGIRVVKNPKKPLWDKDVFILEEELSIGDTEGKKEYMFSQIKDIAVDYQERIYILDEKEAHIKTFDKNGKYISTIGRKGQGPGEIGAPRNLHITRQNEIVIIDMSNRRLAFFSLTGDYIKNISSAKVSWRSTGIDSKGNIIGVIAKITEDGSLRHELMKFDPNMNYLFSFISYPAPSQAGFNPYMPVLRWCLGEKDHIICGYPKKYEINVFNFKGEVIKKIIKEYEPVEIAEDEQRKLEELPPTIKVIDLKHKSAFQRLIVDDLGKIFVMTWEKATNTDGFFYDIFDSEGKYIVKVPLKTFPSIIRQNKLYTIEEDEDGYQYVKRYQVYWKI